MTESGPNPGFDTGERSEFDFEPDPFLGDRLTDLCKRHDTICEQLDCTNDTDRTARLGALHLV